jgi:thiol:disulfide interchange protein DsbD
MISAPHQSPTGTFVFPYFTVLWNQTVKTGSSVDSQNILENALQSGSMLAYPLAFFSGLLASLSPCIYPLLPVTVAFIGSRSAATRWQGFTQSLAYVVGIAVTYAMLGGFAALSGNLFGMVATHPLTQLAVGLFLIFMALGQFDVFTLSLPHLFTIIVQLKPGHAVGTVAAGMVSGLVVSPCTIPVFGALLVYVASRNNVLFGTTLMFTFAMGMGMVLIAAGTFSSLLSRMPRSGPWLVIVKMAMGMLLMVCGLCFIVRAAMLY